jgi:hypothetical protein
LCISGADVDSASNGITGLADISKYEAGDPLWSPLRF